MANETKMVKVRWTAVYETTLVVPVDTTEEQIRDTMADININVAGSKLQVDTWEIESIESEA